MFLTTSGVLLFVFNKRHFLMKDCFNLTVDEYHDVRSRNKSEIIVKSCFAWLCTDESPVSGMAMLEMDIPSGYIMLQVCISK